MLLLSVDEAPMLARSLPGALSAVAELGAGGHRVVVVDNACTDATSEIATALGAEVLPLPNRHTYAQAINVAINRTGGEAVLLLNADCVLQPGFLIAALPRLAEPGVGSVAAKLLRADRSDFRPLDQIDAAGMSFDRRRKNGLVGHGEPTTAWSAPGAAFGTDGAAALLSRAMLQDCAVGGGEVLDEDLELWATDADLAWRAQLLGWQCAYEPQALARHVRTYSPTTRAQMSKRARRMQFRNRLLMMVKNETGADLRRDLPQIAAYEVLALGHALLRERHLLRGYTEAFRLAGRARTRRRQVQARRRVARVPFGLQPPP